jgi:hypothetical protein
MANIRQNKISLSVGPFFPFVVAPSGAKFTETENLS